MARTEFALAAKLRPRKVSDFTGPEHLRSDLIESINDYRREQSELVIGDFNADTFKPSESSSCALALDRWEARPAASPSFVISYARTELQGVFPAFASQCRPPWSWLLMPSISS